jgi:pteridine reductase
MNPQAPVALITGAARRIGAAIAQHLHAAGYRVVIHYLHSESAAASVTQKCNELQRDSALAIQGDLQTAETSTMLISTAHQWAGRLDLLVNNACVFSRESTDWDTLFAVNVKAPFLLSQAAYPYLKTTQGAIINITDIHAHKPLKHYSAYCQTQAALTMQTQSLAREFAPDVRVNAIAPGAIAWPEQGNALSETLQHEIIQKTPLKRHGQPKYVAKAVLALVQNSFITGQILAVDGGRSLI